MGGHAALSGSLGKKFGIFLGSGAVTLVSSYLYDQYHHSKEENLLDVDQHAGTNPPGWVAVQDVQAAEAQGNNVEKQKIRERMCNL